MKEFILQPFEIFQREKQMNEEIQQALARSHEVSENKAILIYFFVLANIMLLVMNLIIYLAFAIILVTTPFYPPVALLRIFPPLLFLPLLRLFQTRWIPKVRRVHMDKIGLDIAPIEEKYVS